MAVGYVLRGARRDVVVIAATLEEAEREYQKNKKAIARALGEPDVVHKKGGTGATRAGSIANLILTLKARSFFRQPKLMRELIEELKSMDYHFKASNLTDPLRRLVRNGALRKVKGDKVGRNTRKWAYCEGQDK